jgi:serine/threonine-protein kinase
MPLAPGSLLGPYQVRDLVAEGGMGAVYRARDPRLERDVAIKVIRHGLDAENLARFEREARAVAALSHPNVLAIFDIGWEGEVPYLVTELLVGRTLRALMLAAAVPAADVLPIARQIIDALAAVHALGIVHRDLKPENVFLLDNGFVKLMDFGLAHQWSAPDTLTHVATSPGVVMGTLGYMAPEQVRGIACDARTDVFALGVLLYEMVSGRRPFQGATQADTIAAVLTREPEPLAVPHGLPAALGAVVHRALAKEPGGRFESVRAFGAALAAAGAPTATATPATVPPDEAAVSLAVLPFVDLSPDRDHEYFCQGIAEEILGGLAKVPGIRVAPASAAQRYRGPDVDLSALGRALNVAAALEGSVRASGDRLRIAVRLTDIATGHITWSAQLDRRLADVFEVQDDIARTVVEALHGGLPAAGLPSRLVPPATPDAEAYALYLRGRFHWNERTEAALVESARCFQRAIDRDARFARALAGLADTQVAFGIYGLRPPGSVMPGARTAARAALRLDETLAEAHASLGTVLALYEWDWAAAEQAFARGIALDPAYATGLQWYALHVLAPQGRFVEALDVVRQALRVDPVALPVLVSLGLVHHFAGQDDTAADVLEGAIQTDDTFSPAHFFMAHVRSTLGDQGRAYAHATRALELSGKWAEAVAVRGVVAARAGAMDEARAALEDLQRLAMTRYVSPGVVAQVQCALGSKDAAMESLSAAVEARATDIAWLAVRPALASLREDPRFLALVDRLGVPRSYGGAKP